MVADSKPLTVTILDREYRFACTPEERANLMEAANLLDERMREIKQRGRLLALERIAIMAAMNFAGELLEHRDSQGQRASEVDARIRKLVSRLDDAIETQID